MYGWTYGECCLDLSDALAAGLVLEGQRVRLLLQPLTQGLNSRLALIQLGRQGRHLEERREGRGEGGGEARARDGLYTWELGV